MNPIPIILPVKNRLELTRQTVDTLIKNTKLPFRLIVVSDNSGKKTNDYLKTLLGHDKVSRVIFMPDSFGPGAAKNAGMAIVGDSPFYYITDNDIYFLPNWLEKMYKVIGADKNKKIGVLGGRTHPYHNYTLQMEVGGITIRTCKQQSGYSMLIRNEVWKKCGPFRQFSITRGSGKSDADFCNLVRAGGWEIAHLANSMVLHCGLTNTQGAPVPGIELEKAQSFPKEAIVK